MRVLLVAPQPFYQERGTPIAVRLLAETLCDDGHQVDLLVFHEGEDVSFPGLRLFRAGRPPGVRHVPIGISPQKLICDLFLVARMIGLLLRNRYDVVHAVEEALFPSALLNLFSRRKLVYDMDSWLSEQLTDKWWPLRPLRPLLVGFERAVVRRATVVLPVCEDLAAKVRPWTTADRVVVLPDVPMGDGPVTGVVDDLRGTTDSDSVLGLYVGNLEHYQGIDLLLDALARLPPDTRFRMLVVGGSDADIDRYRQQAEHLGLASRVRFIGRRPVAHLGAYLAQADILVSPRTLGDNTPMKVYSYMQSGKAILATDIRSHTQALDTSCAELVDANPAAMAAGMERLIANAELRSRLGRAARTKAEAEYSMAAYRSRLRRAYEMVATA
jgi:glycosyltransferase involved in cell wall biosynthesis